MQQGTVLFDHFVGNGEHAWRDCEAERLGGLKVDNQFVLGPRWHRQVGRFSTLKDAIDVSGRSPVLVGEVGPIGD
jgi:hypothetical protein